MAIPDDDELREIFDRASTRPLTLQEEIDRARWEQDEAEAIARFDATAKGEELQAKVDRKPDPAEIQPRGPASDFCDGELSPFDKYFLRKLKRPAPLTDEEKLAGDLVDLGMPVPMHGWERRQVEPSPLEPWAPDAESDLAISQPRRAPRLRIAVRPEPSVPSVDRNLVAHRKRLLRSKRQAGQNMDDVANRANVTKSGLYAAARGDVSHCGPDRVTDILRHLGISEAQWNGE